eukprot:364822-Chlamydomonas_euryale.AAC.8
MVDSAIGATEAALGGRVRAFVGAQLSGARDQGKGGKGREREGKGGKGRERWGSSRTARLCGHAAERRARLHWGCRDERDGRGGARGVLSRHDSPNSHAWQACVTKRCCWPRLVPQQVDTRMVAACAVVYASMCARAGEQRASTRAQFF